MWSKFGCYNNKLVLDGMLVLLLEQHKRRNYRNQNKHWVITFFGLVLRSAESPERFLFHLSEDM